MNDLTTFAFDGEQVRTATDTDGRPLFVLTDVCRVLGITNPSNVATRLDFDDLRTVEVIDSMGRPQRAHAVTESGAIDVTLDSRKPEARRFRRWLTHDVVPQIMQTGGYQVPEYRVPQTLPEALRLAAEAIEERDDARAVVQALTPLADVGAAFLSADGDYSVAEAANVLSRDHGIETGEKRLFQWLDAHGWIVRHGGHPAPRQSRITDGTMRSRARTYPHPVTGLPVVGAPQVRITPRGVQLIAQAMRREARAITAEVTA